MINKRETSACYGELRAIYHYQCIIIRVSSLVVVTAQTLRQSTLLIPPVFVTSYKGFYYACCQFLRYVQSLKLLFALLLLCRARLCFYFIFSSCSRLVRRSLELLMDEQTVEEVWDTDLTKGEPTPKNNTIEELKSKLGHQEIVDEEETMIPDSLRNTGHHPAPPLLSDDGLIMPRKPTNPVRENPDRQNLHKELLFNQKIGKNVLNQKTELQRALEKQKNNLAKKQLENHIAEKTPELEKVIADRAKRLQNPNEDKNEDDKVLNKELLQIRMKLKTRNNSN